MTRFAVGVALVLAAAGIGWTLLSAETRKAIKPTAAAARAASLQLNGPLSAAFAGEMVAARLGLFDHEGVTLSLQAGDAGIDPIRSVESGAAAIGIMSATAFTLARARGAAAVAFAAAYLESPIVFFTLQSSGIRTPGDFGGRTINVKPGDDAAIIHDALMARVPAPVRQTAVVAPLSALLAGEIDIWASPIVPAARELEQKGVRYNVIRPASYGVHVPGTVYFASETTVRDRPELVERVLRAIIAGWERVYADVDQSAAVVAAVTEPPLAVDGVRFDLDIQRDFVRPLGRRFAEFDDSQWRALNQTLVGQRRIKAPVDLSRAVNYEFLREAYRKSSAFGKVPPDAPMFGPFERHVP